MTYFTGFNLSVLRDIGPDGEFLYYTINDIDRGTVASTWAPEDEVESKELADLFAAAPEMLEVLKVLVGGDGTEGTMQHAIYVRAVADAMKLIAKIEGR